MLKDKKRKLIKIKTANKRKLEDGNWKIRNRLDIWWPIWTAKYLTNQIINRNLWCETRNGIISSNQTKTIADQKDKRYFQKIIYNNFKGTEWDEITDERFGPSDELIEETRMKETAWFISLNVKFY